MLIPIFQHKRTRVIKVVIIDEDGNEICYLNVPFIKMKLDSDVEPECRECDRPLREGNIIYTSEQINHDLCSTCFKRLEKSLNTDFQNKKN